MSAQKVMNERDALAFVQRLRQQGKRLVFTNGCFDLLHPGHVVYLEAARVLGDALLVAVNADASVRALKGPGRPVLPARDRARLLAALACVDAVTIFNDLTAERLVALLQPEIYVKGGDYAEGRGKRLPEAQAVGRYGGQICLMPLQEGYSTTALLQRIFVQAQVQQEKGTASSMVERTLVIVKPDGVQRGLVGEILRRFEQRGLKIVGLKLIQIERALAERHYAIHQGKPFYNDLINFITAAPVVCLVLEGPQAIKVVRDLVGATRFFEAAAGTIRGDFALNLTMNLIHASDSPETAKAEISLFFQPAELVEYRREIDRWTSGT